jgi:transcriptional regulator with XRE-family HTH domain
MIFADKLSWLMKNFNISNNKLAKAISIDPSLVSKWVNGKRVPPVKSPYIIQIAEYFLKFSHDEYKPALLLELLAEEFPHLNLEHYVARRRALIEWLSGQGASSRGQLKSINSREKAKTMTSNDAGQTSGKQGFYKLFRDKDGRRQSVINFLQVVLKAHETVELLLISQEDIAWIIEYEEFLSQWKLLLTEIIKRGHKIKIIHTVHRDISQITAMINNWIPLHLTGRVESFYHPKYEEPTIFKSVFIASGITSIVSFSTSTENDSEYTFQFSDAVVLGLLEQNYRSYLAQCRPLVQAFMDSEILQIFNDVVGTQIKPGYFYTLRNSLISLTMPVGLFARILEKSNLNSKEKEERIQLHRIWTEAFLQTIKINHFREICPIGAIDLMINENTYIYSGSEFFLVEPIELDASDVREHLTNIIDILENNNNYELILFNTRPTLMPENVSLFFKEDYYAIVSSRDSIPYAIETNEGNILHAFEDYFEEIYEHIPVNNRTKSWVINKLKKRIVQLERLLKK